jgi:hypothetical protein
VLFAAAEAEPKVFQLLLKHEDLLHLSDAVINAWRKQLAVRGLARGISGHERNRALVAPTCRKIQNQALDHFGLFWCRNPVQNRPHEIRLRTRIDRRPEH